VAVFFGGRIPLDPLWNPSSYTDPIRKLSQELGFDPLLMPWASNESIGCFLPVCCGRKNDFAGAYCSKLNSELNNGIRLIDLIIGHISEAIVLVKFDLSLPWVRLALSQWPAHFHPSCQEAKGKDQEKEDACSHEEL
jgi:hypothetical protein